MGSYEGSGSQTDKTPAAKSPYMSFGLAFYQSNLSTHVVIHSFTSILIEYVNRLTRVMATILVDFKSY